MEGHCWKSLAERLPDWGRMGRGVRSNVAGALRLLGCRTWEELLARRDHDQVAGGGGLATDRRAWLRSGLRTLYAQLDLWRLAAGPAREPAVGRWFLRLHPSVRRALAPLTAGQHDMLCRLDLGRSPRRLRRSSLLNVALALRHSSPRLRACEDEEAVRRCLVGARTDEDDDGDLMPTRTLRRVNAGLRCLWELCVGPSSSGAAPEEGHPGFGSGRSLTPAEEAWLRRSATATDSGRGTEAFYVELKAALLLHRRGRPVARDTVRDALQVVRAMQPPPASHADLVQRAGELPQAVVDATLEALCTNPTSLLGRGRVTRSSVATGGHRLLGLGCLRRKAAAARWLLSEELPGAPEGVLPRLSPAALWPRLYLRLRHHDALVSGPDEFTDVIAGDDVTAMLERGCRTTTETLLVLLCSRLGMRIGAVSALRLAGVVDPESLRPPLARSHADAVDDDVDGRWIVRPWISAWDKGRQVNRFPVGRCPEVTRCLERYLETVWRPTYEVWTTTAGPAEEGGRGVLRCEFLFPGRHWRQRPYQHRSARQLRDTLVAVMRRAGITGPRAHPHALRKGFCTDLFRAGNRPEVVARAMHHRHPQVTLQYYDKRSDAEILANLVLPRAWCDGDGGTEEGDGEEARPANPSPGTAHHEEGAAAPPPSSSGGDDAVLMSTAALALGAEMQCNDVLRQQHALILACLPGDRLAAYQRECAALGLPWDVPLPQQ